MSEPCFILKEYLKYHNENIQKFGENTVVLMQVGSFYEIYSVQNDSIHVGADIYKLADILGIQVVRRNKSIPEISYDNFLMSGWNMYATEKFQKILLNHNYTIVFVDQVTEPPNPERKITNIGLLTAKSFMSFRKSYPTLCYSITPYRRVLQTDKTSGIINSFQTVKQTKKHIYFMIISNIYE